MSKEKSTFKWLEKLKNVKHIEIYIAVIFIVILLLIFMSSKKTVSGNTTYSKAQTETSTSVVNYIETMETNLESILTKINGLSNVEVMITLDMADAKVESSNITLDKFPAIKGVLVTAKGLNNTSLKMKVLQALQAVVEVKNDNIALLSSD